MAAGWVGQDTDPEARDPVSGWAVAVEVREAGEQVEAEPGAAVLVRQEVAAVPACGIRVRPAAVVAVLEAAGQERAGVGLAVGREAVLVQVPVAQAESAEAVGVELVLERGRARARVV